MSAFAYVSVLTSIVVGPGVAHLLQGVATIVQVLGVSDLRHDRLRREPVAVKDLLLNDRLQISREG